MAKSLRSKRKRKIRAEKRIVNAKKELVKLKQVAAKLHGIQTSSEQRTNSAQQLTKAALESSLPDVQVTDECPMQVEEQGGGARRGRGAINTQWMNQKKIKAIKSKIKKHNSRKARRSGTASVSSRRAVRRSK